MEGIHGGCWLEVQDPPKFLQSYILPIAVATTVGGSARVEKIFGTGFVLRALPTEKAGSPVLTAAHVIESARRHAELHGGYVAIVGKTDSGEGDGSVVARIIDTEFAPNGSDIALCVSLYRSDSTITLIKEEALQWRDVATLGYPDDAISGPPDALRLNLRAQKGYIQRLIRPDDLVHRPQLSGYELNFQLAAGMSGSPVFIYHPDGDRLIGVAIGTFGSETILSEIVEVSDDGSSYKELHKNVNQYGVVESIEFLRDWRPNCLEGLSLQQFVDRT